MIASHYAKPLDAKIAAETVLRCKPSTDSDAIVQLSPGEPFSLVEDSRGWAWGYAGPKRLVGYVPSDALHPR